MEIVNRLRSYGVQFEIQKKQDSKGGESAVLAGLSIVISGTFEHHSREEYKSLIETYGGKNVSSISAKTSFVLAGENMGPSKQEKARQLGIPLKTEAEFLSLIGINGESDTSDEPQKLNKANQTPLQLELFD